MISNIPPATNQIHLKVAKFYNKIANSNNNLLNYIYHKFKCNNVSIIGRNLSLLYKTYDVSSIPVYMLGGVIVGSRGVASVQHICTMNAIHYLRNDAVLDNTFSKDEAASFLYYLYCN